MSAFPLRFLENLKQLDSTPGVALRVIEAASRNDTSIDQISRMIEADPALATRVLKVANSAWLGFSAKVSTMQRATTLLGVDMVRCLALSVAISRLFLQDKNKRVQEVFLGLWQHSLGTAIAAELVAGTVPGADPKTAFIAGLLHDIGKFVLLQWDWEAYGEVLQEAFENQNQLMTVETARLGVSHPFVGDQLLQIWGFPERLRQAVAHHHLSSEALKGRPGSQLAVTVKYANALCHQTRLGRSGNPVFELSREHLGDDTGVSIQKFQELALAVLQRYDERAALFELEGGTSELYLRMAFEANAELATMYTGLKKQREERTAYQKQLQIRDRQLDQARRLEAIGQLAGGVAHDFNNLLTVIKGHVELAGLTARAEAPISDHLREIEAAANRAATLTEQLLAFSKRQALRPRPLDINAEIEAMRPMLERLGGDNLKQTVRPDRELKPVMADPGQIDQILIHLLLNAKDAMPHGGSITIETRQLVASRADWPEGAPKADRDYCLLAISDTGVGMDEATLQRAFEPFFTTKGVGEGSGLGLSTVYGIVSQFGGSLHARSAPGEGTTVEVYLPNLEEKKDLAEGAGAGRPGILVVEDEISILKLIERALTASGFSIFAATTPEEAEELFGKSMQKIDLLLTDVILPKTKGTELHRRLSARKPELKVLFMSGYSQQLIEAAPGVPFIQKPFTPTTLCARIREILQGSTE
ncbi:MAG: HDOD domain-containing protein [Acidobacteriota bacterium]